MKKSYITHAQIRMKIDGEWVPIKCADIGETEPAPNHNLIADYLRGLDKKQ